MRVIAKNENVHGVGYLIAEADAGDDLFDQAQIWVEGRGWVGDKKIAGAHLKFGSWFNVSPEEASEVLGKVAGVQA